MAADDRMVRVIVGRKGSGKTLYLRRLQAAAQRERSLYADAWRLDLPTTSEVVRVSDLSIARDDAIERWERIWQRAVQRALISHFLCSGRLRVALQRFVPTLQTWERSLTSSFDAPMSVYSQVSEIVNKYRGTRSLDTYLGDSAWNAVEHGLREMLDHCPPVCFYLDAVDERFEAAPRQWLVCQLGLYNQVLTLLADPHFGSRLHVVIGVRDLVFSSTQTGEHATRHGTSDYVRYLDWDHAAILYFLHQRIDAVDADYRMSPEVSDPVERWLGMRQITNTARGIDEQLDDYMLRHTRLIPRDIVHLGNSLCDLIDRSADQTFLLQDDVRTVVRSQARKFGDEQLMIVANHVTSSAMPRGAADWGIDGLYTGEDGDATEGGRSLQEGLRELVKDLLRRLHVDRFSRDALDSFAAHARSSFGDTIDLPSILWQHGLLGYIHGPIRTGEPVFYAATHEDSVRLPRGKHGYALHPILIDAVGGLRGVGNVVHPYARAAAAIG
jgi:hypothetical protein